MVKAGEKATVKAGEKAVVKAGEKAVVKAGEKAVVKAGEKAVVKTAGKAVAKTGAKAGVGIAKAGAKKIPVAGLVVGGAFAAWRSGWGIFYMAQGNFKKGASEFTKAGLEVASGAVAIVPGLGTGASVAIDAGLIAWDVADDVAEAKSSTIDKKDN